MLFAYQGHCHHGKAEACHASRYPQRNICAVIVMNHDQEHDEGDRKVTDGNKPVCMPALQAYHWVGSL